MQYIISVFCLLLGENTTLANFDRLNEVELCSLPPESGSNPTALSTFTIAVAIITALISKLIY